RTDGSEIWRGGYANRRFSWFDANASEADITADAATSIVNDIFCRYARLLKGEFRQEHERYAKEWIKSCRGKPLAVAERFYLEFEFGRHNLADVVRSAEYNP